MDSQDKKGQVENILTELGKKIDELIEDAKDAKDSIRDDLEVKIEKLKARKSKIESEFKNYQADKEDRWTGVREHLEKALSEIKAAASSAFKSKE
ncbi:MAG: hypothetical protein RJQ09_09675 [Cyclobacteriaceae bacterium]